MAVKTRTASRIRSGLERQALAELFRGLPTYAAAAKFHRGKLTSVAALAAFDRAQTAADWKHRNEAAKFSQAFDSIIDHNFS